MYIPRSSKHQRTYRVQYYQTNFRLNRSMGSLAATHSLFVERQGPFSSIAHSQLRQIILYKLGKYSWKKSIILRNLFLPYRMLEANVLKGINWFWDRNEQKKGSFENVMFGFLSIQGEFLSDKAFYPSNWDKYVTVEQ